MRTIKEAIYIRVNNQSLNRNVGKYYLPCIWDGVHKSSLLLMYLSSNFKTFHSFHKLPKFKYFASLLVRVCHFASLLVLCMPMHSLIYVKKGYKVIDLVIIWN